MFEKAKVKVIKVKEDAEKFVRSEAAEKILAVAIEVTVVIIVLALVSFGSKELEGLMTRTVHGNATQEPPI